jgi:hypothetical protein
MDGFQWKSGKLFICPAVVDGDYEDVGLEDELFVKIVEDEPANMVPSEPMAISLLEIARPPRPTRLKGNI